MWHCEVIHALGEVDAELTDSDVVVRPIFYLHISVAIKIGFIAHS